MELDPPQLGVKAVNVAMSSALSGIRNSIARMNEGASNIAGKKTDPIVEIVIQINAKADYQASVAALEAAQETEKSAVRLWA